MILSLQPEYMGDGSASPGACFFCRAARRPGEPVVDFCMQVDSIAVAGAEGWLQACGSCMAEVGRLLGMLSADDAVRLAGERDVLLGELAETEARLALVETALDAMTTVRDRPRRPKGAEVAE